MSENVNETTAVDEDTVQTPTLPEIKPVPQHTERGIPLLRALWEQIKRDNSAWYQGSWISTIGGGDAAGLRADVVEFIKENEVVPWNCGTAYCMAGHAALATGAKLTRDDVDGVETNAYLSPSTIITPDGQRKSVEDYGREVLNLTEDQANVLFAGSNGAYQIECMIRALEDNPRDTLWNVQDEARAATAKRRAFEKLYGFGDPEHKVVDVLAALRREFPYTDDKILAGYVALATSQGAGADITGEQIHTVHMAHYVLENSNYETKPWDKVNNYTQYDYNEYADRLKNALRAADEGNN